MLDYYTTICGAITTTVEYGEALERALSTHNQGYDFYKTEEGEDFEGEYEVEIGGQGEGLLKDLVKNWLPWVFEREPELRDELEGAVLTISANEFEKEEKIFNHYYADLVVKDGVAEVRNEEVQELSFCASELGAWLYDPVDTYTEYGWVEIQRMLDGGSGVELEDETDLSGFNMTVSELREYMANKTPADLVEEVKTGRAPFGEFCEEWDELVKG